MWGFHLHKWSRYHIFHVQYAHCTYRLTDQSKILHIQPANRMVVFHIYLCTTIIRCHVVLTRVSTIIHVSFILTFRIDLSRWRNIFISGNLWNRVDWIHQRSEWIWSILQFTKKRMSKQYLLAKKGSWTCFRKFVITCTKWTFISVLVYCTNINVEFTNNCYSFMNILISFNQTTHLLYEITEKQY